MRLVTFTRRDSGGAAALHTGALLPGGGQILDFFVALEVSEKEFKSPAAVLKWFDLAGSLFPSAADLYEKYVGRNGKVELPESAIISRGGVKLLAPIPRPGKLICIGLNYRDHAEESKMSIPERPLIFSKFTTSVIGPDESIVLPQGSQKSDYEAELAVVIGRRGKNVKPADAFDYVLGYANLNDVSERAFQFADGQWQRGKSCDTFAPLGPFIATKDEISDPHALSVRLRLNGKTLQDSSTEQLIYDIPALISYISETVTLEPGDVIATGTPPGVGFARNPPVFLKSGDVVEVEVEGLGILSNPVSQQQVEETI